MRVEGVLPCHEGSSVLWVCRKVFQPRQHRGQTLGSALSPQAKAYSLLKELNLGCSLDAEGKKVGRMEFIEGGWHPGSSACWVELRDDLTVSLLQAAIIERDLPLKITIDGL